MLPSLTLCLANNIAQAQSSAARRGDNQLWNELQLAAPINKQNDFVLLGVIRFGKNVSRPVYELVEAEISVKVGKYLTLLPSYLYFALQPTKTNHNREHRITLEATARFPIRGFVVSDRNRVEFHFHSPPPNFIQYRNRVQIQHSLRFRDLHGFVSDEVFYHSVASAWIRNRVYVGVAKEINKHFTLEMYYMRQNDSHSHPADLNALASSFKVRL